MKKNPSSLLFILDQKQEKVMLVNYVDSPFGATKWGGMLYPYLTSNENEELFFANFITEFFLLTQNFYTNDDWLYIGDVKHIDKSFIDENGFINILNFSNSTISNLKINDSENNNNNVSKIETQKIKAEDVLINNKNNNLNNNKLNSGIEIFSEIPSDIDLFSKDKSTILDLDAASEIYLNDSNLNSLVKKFGVYVSITNDFSFLNRVTKNSDYIIKSFDYNELKKMHKDNILSYSTYEICSFIFEHFRNLDNFNSTEELKK